MFSIARLNHPLSFAILPQSPNPYLCVTSTDSPIHTNLVIALDITWLGHSCFRFRAGKATLITDPYADTLGLPLGKPTAHIVTISNGHPHHNSSEQVAGDPKVVTGPGEYEIHGFYIKGIRAPSGADQTLDNTAYLIQIDGLTLCHLGDLADPLVRQAREQLRSIDILFVPAGGGCTVSPTQAAELVNLLDPKIVVPMHFHVKGVEVELDSPEPFLRKLGIPNQEPRPTLSVTSASLPQERQVVVLQPAAA